MKTAKEMALLAARALADKKAKEVQELEIAALRYIVRGSDLFSGAEAYHLDLCREVRNLLAHNEQTPFEQVRRLMEEPGF